MPTDQIRLVSVDKLKAHPKNARTHSKKQLRQIADSIECFGFTNPILADENNAVLAGHGRLAAARLIGLREVPTVTVSGLSEAQKRAYILADNKLAENAGWDRKALAVELSGLTPLLSEIGLDISITGFAPAEIDVLLGDLSDPEADPADEPPTLATEPVSRIGDVWLLGAQRHRIICGDARDASHFRKLMGGRRAAMVFADPPYNVAIKSIQGRGKIKHGDFAMACGEMSKAQFTAFLTETLLHAAEYSARGSIHFVCMDWRHMEEMLGAGNAVYTQLKNLVVWNKTNAGQGSFYRSQHELIFAYKNGERAHTNNFELGQHGRNRSNIWTYAGVNTFRAGRMDELTLHPTVKPIALVADAMRDCSRRGEVVLDPFMGSGTTILAAERVGRRAYGLELDPLYVDAAVRRWQRFTKADAVLKGSRKTFDEIAEAVPRQIRGGLNE
ncbi:DNA methylase N-4 [Methyloceanibacter marginalis]|uniref:Methyltransferase n=1 Tax=Methyloceanibacter marginalis TaxID=1774971 RepID=A0A1E3WD55_9HYPH|nr:DNA methyltransferase [Methyloceanibacter marginalis]ODS03462.1 DNA methylase N-4 [Methyloceanibacter marginalis]